MWSDWSPEKIRSREYAGRSRGVVTRATTCMVIVTMAHDLDDTVGGRVPFNEPAIMSFDDYNKPDPLLTVKPFIDLTNLLQPMCVTSNGSIITHCTN